MRKDPPKETRGSAPEPPLARPSGARRISRDGRSIRSGHKGARDVADRQRPTGPAAATARDDRKDQPDTIIPPTGTSPPAGAGPENPHFERQPSNRHIHPIAIGGAIGTGLFMGPGKTISFAGPVMILVYMIIGSFFTS